MKSKEEIELTKDISKFIEKPGVGRLPLHELFLTTFSLSITILLFMYPELFTKNVAAYKVMTGAASQYVWAIAFLSAGVTKGIGLMGNYKLLRKIGLFMSTVLYASMSLAYASDFPSVTAILYALMAVFAIVAMFQVRITNIN